MTNNNEVINFSIPLDESKLTETDRQELQEARELDTYLEQHPATIHEIFTAVSNGEGIICNECWRIYQSCDPILSGDGKRILVGLWLHADCYKKLIAQIEQDLVCLCKKCQIPN